MAVGMAGPSAVVVSWATWLLSDTQRRRPSHHIRASASSRYGVKHTQGIAQHLGLLSLSNDDHSASRRGSETQLWGPDLLQWRKSCLARSGGTNGCLQ